MKISGTSDLGRLVGLQRQAADTKARLNRAAEEMTTGLNSSRYDATSGNITRVFAIERALDRNAVFAGNVALTEVRLDTTQNALGLILDPLQNLSTQLPASVALNDVGGSLVHANSARVAFRATVSALNTTAGGLSLFAGTATDGPALASADDMLATLDGLAQSAATPAAAIAAINDYFTAPAGGFFASGYIGSPDDLSPVDVGESRRLDYAIRADQSELVEVMRSEALAAVVAGGAFAGDNPSRMTMLAASGAAMMTAKEGMLALRSAVGVSQETLEKATASLTAEKDTLDLARNAIMVVDPTTSTSLYQALETQLETIYTVTSRLGELSYAKYM